MTRQDEEHLKLLSVLHIVHAVMIGMASLFPLIYVVLGGVMIFAPHTGKGSPPPAGVGAVIAAIGLFFSGYLVFKAAANGYTAYAIKARKGRMFCIITSAFNCLHFGLGTALGIFTIVTLQKAEVIAEFEKNR